jgi:endonuclease-3
VTALEAILDRLEGHYGALASPTPADPYDLVIFLNSGYPASDERCAKGYIALEAAIGLAPEAILAADEAALARTLKAGGIVPELRAQRLKQIARFVQGDLAGDLRAALMADPARAKALLKRFPTIGDPAAERILLFCGLQPEPAAPASCPHVLVRLGLCEEGKDFPASYRAARAAISSGVAEDFAARRRAYLLLKAHAHGLCRRSAPRCEACPVSAGCAYFLETLETAAS